MSRYSRKVEIVFPVAKIAGQWEHDTLPMPKCLAGWLESHGFPPVCDIVVYCTVRGRYTGFDGDDDHEFVCHGGEADGNSIPADVLNCALSGEWEDHFNQELADARQAACVAI